MIAKDTRLFQEQCRRDELAPTVLEQLAVERITHPVPDVSLATPASALARGPRTPVTPPPGSDASR
jgi:hypothetical protein